MKLRIKGVYPKHKALADGRMVTYWYHRKTGARLPDDPESPEFLERVLELNSGKAAPPTTAPHYPTGAREKIGPNDGSGADEQPEIGYRERSSPPPRPSPRSSRAPSPRYRRGASRPWSPATGSRRPFSTSRPVPAPNTSATCATSSRRSA